MLCHGFVTSYEGLAVARIFLGITEAGYFPAATYLLSTWYCRFEYQTRLGIFYGAAAGAGAFSGLLAYGLQHMDGVGGKAGWCWIFIIEGLITVLAGLATPFILPDSVDTATWLDATEKMILRTRLEQDSGTASGKVAVLEKFQWGALRAAVLDWKIWFAILIFWGNTYAELTAEGISNIGLIMLQRAYLRFQLHSSYHRLFSWLYRCQGTVTGRADLRICSESPDSLCYSRHLLILLNFSGDNCYHRLQVS